MEMSGFLLKLTKIMLNALIKTTNADIRTHGEENIPDQPTVFVINHFTRMETFFMPYIIYGITNKEILSLASSDLFSGGFGRYLQKIGGVSTDSPDRDKIMIGSLLNGELDCLIFPEGQMIKDKKLIEKGKYMVYNSGIRRPPHTGSAIIALRAEFYREKLRYFYEQNNETGISAYCNYFDLNPSNVEKIIKYETQIMPVNVTYFPVRARRNIINKIASKFVNNVPERIEEELEVEGTMLIDGVDIDVNFGNPISVRPLLNVRHIRNKFINNKLYLDKSEIEKDINIKKISARVTQKYMNSIYSMTTVNHDHILAYILSTYKTNKINEVDFKNRAFLAIYKIRDKLKYHHTLLSLKQNYLLMDDDNDKYRNFIETLQAESLISVKDGCIYINKDRFSRVYEFHTIRKDNIVEVLKNEIEPLEDIVKDINSIMRIPSFFIRREISSSFRKRDLELFEQDYNQYYIEGETKPKEIGRPFFLKRFFRKKGILLIHGYMSAPEEMRELGEYLYKNGYNVYGVRLRGHGTSPEDLANRKWEVWLKSVRRGEQVLRNTVKKMAVIGFSTGAGLALYKAAKKKEHYSCVISINAPLRLANIGSRLASTVVMWNHLLERMHIHKGKKEFVANDPQNPTINYFRNPLAGVVQLEKLMHIVEGKLKDIQIPALVIQGNNDPVVNPKSGEEVFNRIGNEDKELCLIEADEHVIVRGRYASKVFAEVKRFLDINM